MMFDSSRPQIHSTTQRYREYISTVPAPRESPVNRHSTKNALRFSCWPETLLVVRRIRGLALDTVSTFDRLLYVTSVIRESNASHFARFNVSLHNDEVPVEPNHFSWEQGCRCNWQWHVARSSSLPLSKKECALYVTLREPRSFVRYRSLREAKIRRMLMPTGKTPHAAAYGDVRIVPIFNGHNVRCMTKCCARFGCYTTRSDYAAVAGAILAIWAMSIYPILRPILHRFRSPIRHLPGPSSVSLLWGNVKQMTDDITLVHSNWIARYGKVFRFNTEFGGQRLFVGDTRAALHILTHSDVYQKSVAARRGLSIGIGDGLLTVEGDEHKKQRRTMNPAFGLAQLRELNTVFLDKSIQLRDVLLAKLGSSASDLGRESSATMELDIIPLLNKCTLDIIGLAGFDYDFCSLDSSERPNELNEAMRKLLFAKTSFLDIAHILLPFTRIIPSERLRMVAESRAVMDAVGCKLIERTKAEVRASTGGDVSVEKKDVLGKSLLSLLVRANMASDLPESQRLSDQEILAQCPVFILAGHETTSTSVTWILYALSCHPEVQDKLRAEISDSDFGDRPTMSQLGELSYLDAVLRETLRVYPPVPIIDRAVFRSDVIPTSGPVEDARGVPQAGIRVVTGDSVAVSVLALHRSTDIWGPDADVYRPERWLGGPPAGASALVGIWPNTMAFSAGPKACIGYLFSIVETKALVYTLIRSMSFSSAVPPTDVAIKSTGILRPFLVSKPEADSQLMLKVAAV